MQPVVEKQAEMERQHLGLFPKQLDRSVVLGAKSVVRDWRSEAELRDTQGAGSRIPKNIVGEKALNTDSRFLGRRHNS